MKATFLKIETPNGEPLPISWFLAFQNLMKEVARSQGMKEWNTIQLTICSEPFDPEWKKQVDERLKVLEDKLKV